MCNVKLGLFRRLFTVIRSNVSAVPVHNDLVQHFFRRLVQLAAVCRLLAGVGVLTIPCRLQFCHCQRLQPQRLQPSASPQREIIPPGPPSERETHKLMQNQVQNVAPRSRALAGPGSSGVLDARWYNLSLILVAFYAKICIYLLLLLMFYSFSVKYNLSGRK